MNTISEFELSVANWDTPKLVWTEPEDLTVYNDEKSMQNDQVKLTHLNEGVNLRFISLGDVEEKQTQQGFVKYMLHKGVLNVERKQLGTFSIVIKLKPFLSVILVRIRNPNGLRI